MTLEEVLEFIDDATYEELHDILDKINDTDNETLESWLGDHCYL